VCNNGNEERLMRLSEELTLADMAHIALFNLTLETTKKYHDLDMSILPFIENNWKYFHPSGEVQYFVTVVDCYSKIQCFFLLV
jgi:hypothetical protein